MSRKKWVYVPIIEYECNPTEILGIFSTPARARKEMPKDPGGMKSILKIPINHPMALWPEIDLKAPRKRRAR